MSTPSFVDLYKAIDYEPLDISDEDDKNVYVQGLHQPPGGINPVDELRTNIEMCEKPNAWLFTGHRGVGKSTELRRMAYDLEAAGHTVIVADMSEYLNLAEPISIEVLLLTLAAALAEGVQSRFGVDPLEEGLLTRFVDFLRTEVGLQEIELNAGVFNLKTALKEKPDLRKKIVNATQSSPARLAQQVKDFSSQIVDRFFSEDSNAKLVLILDSLERLRVTGADAKTDYRAIADTFDLHAEYLKLEHIDVVYSVPPYLKYLCPRIGSHFGVGIFTLPHTKVFKTPSKNDDPLALSKPDTHGIKLMLQCASKRYPDIVKLIPEPMLEQLALASSGSIRDFFRLIRSVCSKAVVKQAPPPLTDQQLLTLATQVLKDEMPLPNNDKQWLKKVHQTHENALDTMENLHELARLFDSGIILDYQNGKNWCEVHYLLQADIIE